MSGLDDTCNTNCMCDTAFYQPICANGSTYFSPCYAGCKGEENTTINDMPSKVPLHCFMLDWGLSVNKQYLNTFNYQPPYPWLHTKHRQTTVPSSCTRSVLVYREDLPPQGSVGTSVLTDCTSLWACLYLARSWALSPSLPTLLYISGKLINHILTSYHSHINLTSIPYQSHINLTSISHQSQINLTSISHQSHINLTSISHQSHIKLISISYQSHINLTSILHQSYINLTSILHQAYNSIILLRTSVSVCNISSQ